MKIEKRIHNGYAEWEKTPSTWKIINKSMFGKYQYICSSKKGRVSIISFSDRITDGKWKWEMYGFENMFSDVERFNTLDEAKAKAMEYLD